MENNKMKEKKVRDFLESYFGNCTKLEATACGVPDVIVTIDKIAVFIEIKNHDDSLIPLQKKFLSDNRENSFLLHQKKDGFFKLNGRCRNYLEVEQILINNSFAKLTKFCRDLNIKLYGKAE